MNFVASKGDQKAQVSAGTQIINSICNICLLASKRLPTRQIMTSADFHNHLKQTLQEMNIFELLAEEYQNKNCFISPLQEDEEIAQPS
jgi:hypothetical protein